MGYLGRVLRAVSGKSNAETPPHTTQGWSVLGQYIGGDSDGVWKNFTEAQLLDILRKHALVYACIEAVADRVPEAPLEVGHGTGDDWKVDDTHHYNELLARPNALMSWSDVEQFRVANLLATGECYLWKLRDDAGDVVELWPLPSSWINPVWSDDTAAPIGRYEVPQQGKDPLRIPAMNMVHIRYIDPGNYKKALGPLQAASREYQTDSASQDYKMEMLTNLAVPGVAVFTDKALTKDQQAALKTRLHDIVGPGKRGSTIHLSGQNARLEAIAPLKDLDWPGLNAIDESRICAVFKVPPVVVGARIGIEKSAQFANYSTALWHFYTGTMKPMWLFLADATTRGLVVNEPAEEDKALLLRYDLTDVLGLQGDLDKRAARAVDMLAGGVATVAQAVVLAGLPPLEGDDPLHDARYMPMNMQRIDNAPAAVPDAPHLPDEDDVTATVSGDGDDGASASAEDDTGTEGDE